MSEQITGAQSLVHSLEAAGVTDIFGIPGGAILPLYDPLMDSSQIRHILVRHEQGAGHAAEGYAYTSGKVGVCMATSGPGATNLVTPIADANMDSVPMVAITGQVSSSFIGTDAFQEADIRGITMPITKHSFLVTKADDIPRAIAEAFYLASSGRPGPVLVDVAKDALQAMTTFDWPASIDLPGYHPVTRPHAKQVREAARMIVDAKAPVLYIGGGVIRAGASESLRKLAEIAGLPVVTTLMARGALVDAVFEVEQPPTGGIDGGVTRGDTFHAGGHCAVATGAGFAVRGTGLGPSLRPLAQPELGGVGKIVGLQGLHILA